jgi:radical SAM protein with 4Fe4S-binding SPASM domain
MNCNKVKSLTDEKFFQMINHKMEQDRVPLSGTIDLTRKCNLKCLHCYHEHNNSELKKEDSELDTDKWISIIDEIAEAGCLYLLITGGEPLLRKDFIEIYTHIKMRGMIVTVFTNGTLITDEILNLFADLPPYDLEISVYGATPEIYEKITGVPGSFGKFTEGIKKLINNKIKFSLKTVLMTHNLHEHSAIKEIATMCGADFRTDAAIFPRLNGDMTPVNLRVNPKEAVEIELSDDIILNLWKEYYKEMQGSIFSETLYNCGAGLTDFYIDSRGTLLPCVMNVEPEYDLTRGDFLTGWHKVISGIMNKKVDNDFVCKNCEKLVLCGFCPAFFKLETGSENIHSEYLCEMGQHRYNIIMNQK